MNVKKSILFLTTILVFLVIHNIATAQHYSDWTGFDYLPGKFDSKGRIVFYELQKDYTISLPEYFLDSAKLPKRTKHAIFQKDQSYHHVAFYHDWALALPPCEWDFIRLEWGGILTIKKGYRWDGASRPCKTYDPDNSLFCVDEHHNFRSSLVHDALYDLMRMGYLAPDKSPSLCLGDLTTPDACKGDETGDRNRQMADMLHYMIAVEDGQPPDYDWPDAQSDYFWLREWGACRTHDDSMLPGWKYHVSELTAYASDGKVELKWKMANDAGKDPDYNGHFNPHYGYTIQRDGSNLTTVPPTTTFYTDNTVVNGNVYAYYIFPISNNNNQDDYANEEIVVPVKGFGNALCLDGINDFVEANTVSNDLSPSLFPLPFDPITFEVWVYPEPQSIKSAILAFNTITGDNHNLLFYDGETQKFCYYDPVNGYIFSTTESVAGRWYHVTVTINEINQGALYVNGTQQATFSTTTRPSKGALFSIGQEWDGSATSQHFKGEIDEVRIWNVARTQAEIQADMCRPLVGDESGLVGLWHFDEPHDSQFRKTYDATTNANDGTQSGYDYSDHPFVSSGVMIPMALARDITVELDANGNASITAEQVDAGSSDACGIASMSVSPSSFTCADIGPNTVTLTVANNDGYTSTADATVTVVDNMPPQISYVSASPNVLWPPNHKMTSVEITGASISDNCGRLDLETGHCRIVSVSSSEPVEGPGTGNMDPDYAITGDLTADLRAERSGSGNGRVYTLTLECMDESGNASTSTTDIFVPRRHRAERGCAEKPPCTR
jgi:hypothetical protein